MANIGFLTAAAECTDPDNIDKAISSIDGMASTIDKYGIAIAALALIFVVFVILILFVLRSNRKLIDTLTSNDKNKYEEELLSKLIDNALSNKVETSISEKIDTGIKSAVDPIKESLSTIVDEHALKEKIHGDLVGSYIDINMALKDASRAAFEKLNNASRVAIYVFHNGNDSMRGLPFFKMSCIHEWTNIGKATMRGQSHTNLPLHMYSDFIEDLWKNGEYLCEDVNKHIDTDVSLASFIEFSKTQALFIDAVRDDHSAVIGFVIAEFEAPETFEREDSRKDEIKSILDRMCGRIAPILNYYDNCKK